MPIKKIPSKFKQDTEQLIIDNYHTMTRKELSTLTGVNLTPPDINFVVKKNGLGLKCDFDKYRINERKDEFIELVNNGYSNMEILKHWNLDCDIALISFYRKKWCLEPSPCWQKLTPQMREDIKRMYLDEEKGSTVIAKILGVNQSTVQSFVKNLGLLRDVSQRAAIYSKNNRGEKSRLWRGGHSVHRRSENFRWTHKYKESIRERDGYICQICHKSNYLELYEIKRSLCIHHIIPYKILGDNPPWNLISLCTSCHSKAESKYNDVLIDQFQCVANEQLIQAFIAMFGENSVI